MNRSLRAASGAAVFLITTFCGAAICGALFYDRHLRLFGIGTFVFAVALVAIVTVLSFVGAYLLIADSIKSK